MHGEGLVNQKKIRITWFFSCRVHDKSSHKYVLVCQTFVRFENEFLLHYILPWTWRNRDDRLVTSLYIYHCWNSVFAQRPHRELRKLKNDNSPVWLIGMGGGKHCCVVGCFNSNLKTKTVVQEDIRRISYFSFPKSPEHAEWRARLIAAVNRCDPSFNPDTAHICSVHFGVKDLLFHGKCRNRRKFGLYICIDKIHAFSNIETA